MNTQHFLPTIQTYVSIFTQNPSVRFDFIVDTTGCKIHLYACVQNLPLYTCPFVLSRGLVVETSTPFGPYVICFTAVFNLMSSPSAKATGTHEYPLRTVNRQKYYQNKLLFRIKYLTNKHVGNNKNSNIRVNPRN